MTERPRLRAVLTVLAAVVVWFVLVAPHDADGLHPLALLRIPVEALLLVAAVVLLRGRGLRPLGIAVGVLLAVLLVVKVLDLGFSITLDRAFDPLDDVGYAGSAVGVLDASVGLGGTIGALVGLALVVGGLLWLLPACTLRLLRVALAHRRTALIGTLGLLLVWGALHLSRTQVGGSPVAAATAIDEVTQQAGQVHADLADRKPFDRAIRRDPAAGVPAERLVAKLRGKDVLLVFVESYGRTAVQGTSFSPGIDTVLDAGTRQLDASGWISRSAFLTSPTFGALSWLAHSTLQSGLWVDSQERYNQLLARQRRTLSSTFGQAGWRTVFDVPSVTRPWPEGQAFYGYDHLYDVGNVGYRGPRFGYAQMPDQYTLSALWRRELAPRHRKPVMAEVDLVSSHHPWTPLPHLVPESELGDGSVFDGMPAKGPSTAQVYRSAARVQAAYGASVQYTWRALVQFLREHPDPNLVLVVLGDHQPHTIVSGSHPGHDVPISLIARDPTVLRQTRGWDWQPGLHPGPDAPVWRMDRFRDRFFGAFGGG